MKKGWEIEQLGHMAEVIAGQSPASKYYNKLEEGLPFYQGKKQFSEKFIDDPTTWTTKITKSAIKDDILMSVRAPVGPVNFSTQKICIGRGLAAIRSSDQLDKYYLFYFLLKHESEIVGNSGAVFNSINKEQIEQIEIPVPTLTEQEDIVEILDKAFAAIDQAKANIEQNIANAKDLFQATFSRITEIRGSEWKTVEVQDVARREKGSMRTGPFGSQLLHSEFVDRGIAVLGIDNAVANEFQWRKERFITPEKFKKLNRFQVKPKDVLITIMGTCGRCAIVPDDIPKTINTKHLCCISLDQKKCTSEYLHSYFLYHPIAQKYLKKKAKGAIMAGLNMGIIKELPLLLPSIEEQLALTKVVSSARNTLIQYEQASEKKLTSLDELKKSILQKAFAGELTMNN